MESKHKKGKGHSIGVLAGVVLLLLVLMAVSAPL